jgi:hypothetical protein
MQDIRARSQYDYFYCTCSFDMFIMHFTRVERNSNEGLFSPLPTLSTKDLFLKEYCLCAEEAEASDDISEFASSISLKKIIMQDIRARSHFRISIYYNP